MFQENQRSAGKEASVWESWIQSSIKGSVIIVKAASAGNDASVASAFLAALSSPTVLLL